MENHDWKDGVNHRLDKHEARLDTLDAFKNWIVGGASVVMFMAGLFVEKLKHFFGP